ncbi:MAG: NAD(P)H-binding protein [Clostridiaceae bacterium]
MKKVAIIGATGMIGSRILMELIERDYVITAISRHPFDLPGSTNLIACEGDLMNKDIVTGHVLALENEVLISAINPDPNHLEDFKVAAENLVAIAKKSGVKKLITVGGAGSLLTSEGKMVMDSDGFKPEWRPIALAHKEALDVYKNMGDFKFTWINVSPANMISPDEKTGKYRIGLDEHLLMDSEGKSFISAEDFASAIVDLIPNDEIKNQRITIAY